MRGKCVQTNRLSLMRQMLTNAAHLALALKLLTLTAAVIAVYFQDLSMIFNDALYSEATNYILAIPLLLAYLVYRKSSTSWHPWREWKAQNQRRFEKHDDWSWLKRNKGFSLQTKQGSVKSSSDSSPRKKPSDDPKVNNESLGAWQKLLILPNV